MVASAVAALSGTLMRPVRFSSRNTATAFSNAATGGLVVMPVKGSSAITAGVKERRCL